MDENPETSQVPHPHPHPDPAPSHPTHTTHQARRTRHNLLLETTSSFCTALINTPSPKLPPPSPTALLTKFFTSVPKITEHGPDWARSRLPFLGKTFVGAAACEEYFRVLGETLEMRLATDAFPTPEEGGWAVDINATISGQSLSTSPTSPIKTTFDKVFEGGETEGKGIVNVVGKGVFIAKDTRKEWSESFIYRFSGFDDEGRIGHWEIWADPLSAWVAVGGGGEDLGLPLG